MLPRNMKMAQESDVNNLNMFHIPKQSPRSVPVVDFLLAGRSIVDILTSPTTLLWNLLDIFATWYSAKDACSTAPMTSGWEVELKTFEKISWMCINFGISSWCTMISRGCRRGILAGEVETVAENTEPQNVRLLQMLVPSTKESIGLRCAVFAVLHPCRVFSTTYLAWRGPPGSRR